ncbi:hypothetical protein IV102_28760 [bacterium]|nr:hypothetical protein [bacterium]
MNITSNLPASPQRSTTQAILAVSPRVAMGAADTYIAACASPGVAGSMGCVKLASAVVSLCRSGKGGPPTGEGLSKAGGDFVAALGLFMAAAGAGPSAVAVTAAGECMGAVGRAREYYAGQD